MRIQDAIDKFCAKLEQRHIEAPRLSAELLAAHAIGGDRSEVLAYPDRELSPRELTKFEIYMDRRLKHEPIPYIIERVEFYSIPLYITRGVFIPRPETETLVDAVLDVAHTLDHPPKIYDLCTGSANITIALAHNLDDGEFWASDVSPTAVQVASVNIRDHDLVNFVELREGPILNPLRNELSKDFDILVCNPPYVKSQEITKLSAQIKDHEPIIALDGGRDGMNFIKCILEGAPPILKRGGYVFLEADPTLMPVIRTEVRRRAAYGDFVVHTDLGGQDRVCQFRVR